MASIRITKVPAGEAPEEIRRAWVGLILPLAEEKARREKLPGFGVLSGPKTVLGQLVGWILRQSTPYDGYAVKVKDALAVLAKENPAAAQWWQTNTPRLLTPTALFLFEAAACEELTPAGLPLPGTEGRAVPLNCPNCGGQIPALPQDSNSVRCAYCGTTILVK